MDEPYRRGLLKLAEKAAEQQILMTHGTAILLETAAYFFHQGAANSNLAHKTIVDWLYGPVGKRPTIGWLP